MNHKKKSVGCKIDINPDNRVSAEDKKKKMQIQRMAEAERARFQSSMNGEKPKLYFSYGFSDIDPFTNMAFTWDMWVKFPFKVPKEKCEEFKEYIQNGFEKIFLS